jgi:hypothetical protein
MLKEVIPALWSAVHGFFTPVVLFILLNVVIGTIAVTSKASPPAAAANSEDAGSAGAVGGADQQQQQKQQRRLSRVPSMAFERIRSFNVSRFTARAPEPCPVTEAVDVGYEQPPFPPAVEKEEPEASAEPEPEREQQHAPAHVKRRRLTHVKSRSKAAAELEAPPLPGRLHKSTSEKSAFSHLEKAQEVEETVQAVEKRRAATTRDGAARRLPVQAEAESKEEQEAGGGEVDAQAENFINRFHNQLKLQHTESILRHRETVRRHAAGRRMRDSNKE